MEFIGISFLAFFQFPFSGFLIEVSICLLSWNNCIPNKAIFRILIVELRFPMAIHLNYELPTKETPYSISPFLLSETYIQLVYHHETQRNIAEMLQFEIFPFLFSSFHGSHKQDKNRFVAVVLKPHLSFHLVYLGNYECLSQKSPSTNSSLSNWLLTDLHG